MFWLAPFLLLFQAGNPPFIPAWSGREPIKYCIDASMEPYRAEATYAFLAWALLSGLPYSETRDCGAARTVTYRMQDMAGPQWGVAFSPPPLFAEPWAGDVFVSPKLAGEHLVLVVTLLHETGHAFGLGDSAETGEIMHPALTTERIYPTPRARAAIACLYRGRCGGTQ